METFAENAGTVVINIIIALLFLGVGVWGARKLATFFRVQLQNRLEAGQAEILSHVVYWIIISFVVLFALAQIGIEISLIIIIAATVLLLAGFTLQDILKNLVSGVLISSSKPFKEGDFIEIDGREGIIKRMQPLTTELQTPDNKRVIFPNARFMQSVVVNLSAEEARQLNIVFHIGHEDDIDNVRTEVRRVFDNNEKIKKSPEPQILLSNFADKKVELTLNAWADTSDYSEVYFAIREQIKKRLDAIGVDIS